MRQHDIQLIYTGCRIYNSNTGNNNNNAKNIDDSDMNKYYNNNVSQ